MAPMKIRINCPNCGSFYTGRIDKLEDDDMITCGCGTNIPLDESQRAEVNRAFKEDEQELRKLLIDTTSEKK